MNMHVQEWRDRNTAARRFPAFICLQHYDT